ncbi:MAG: DUF6753 family protein [Cyanobacteria bacterium J06639_18]
MDSTEDLLQGYSQEEQDRINELVSQLGISPDDPMFQIMATLGKYESKVDEVLAAFDGMSAAWSIMLDSKLSTFSETTKTTSQAWINLAIRESISELSSKTKGTTLSNFSKDGGIYIKPIWAAAVVGAVLALGTFIGSGIGFTAYSTIVGKGGSISPNLTPEEIERVKWLKSEEGKIASDVVRRNMAAIKSCQKVFSQLNGNCLIKVPQAKNKSK